MKAHFFLTLIILTLSLLPAASMAQGILVGINQASLSIPDAGSTELETASGPVIGGMVELNQGEQVSLIADAVFVQGGANLREDGRSAQLRLNYLETGFALNVALGQPAQTHPFLGAGLRFGFLTSATFTSEGASESVASLFADTDLSLGISAGLAIPAGRGQVRFEGRYSMGLTNIAAVNPEASLQTRGLQVLFGTNF